MNDLNEFELIEKYLADELDEIEKASFEKRQKKDSAFAKEVNLHKKIHKELFEKEIARYRNITKDCLKKEQSEVLETKIVPLNRFTTFSYISRVAVILIAVFGLIFWYSKYNNKVSADFYLADLANQNPGVFQGQEDYRNQWVTLFNEKKYQKVIEVINQKADKTNEENYYLGLSYLNTATPNYQQFYNLYNSNLKNDSVFYEKSEWLMALVLCKNNDLKHGEIVLKKIANSNSEFKIQAKKLLESI